MKYRDLTALADIEHDTMSKIVGGLTFGELISANVPGIGRGNLVKERFGEPVGEVLRFLSDLTGYPGTNGGKYLNGVDMPPGLV